MSPKGKQQNGKSANNRKGKGRRGSGEGKSKKKDEEENLDEILVELFKSTQRVEDGRQRQHPVAETREPRTRREELTKMKDALDLKYELLNEGLDSRMQQFLNDLMGFSSPFRREPITDFHSETYRDNPFFDVAVGDMQGWRTGMEDTHFVDVAFGASEGSRSQQGLFGVFDGHSGTRCAELCRERFPAVVRRYATSEAEHHHTIDFSQAFLDMDAGIREELEEKGSGCTAVIVYVSPEVITCAWVGDSRAVLCRNGDAFDLSYDHKPEVEAEKERIEAAGGFVQENRVNRQLAMSRAMGDFRYKSDADRDVEKQLVVPVPDVITAKRCADDSYVVLACDGIFDVLSNAELIEFINAKKAEGKTNEEVCRDICHRCLAEVSAEGGPATGAGTDNMTVMIVDLKGG